MLTQQLHGLRGLRKVLVLPTEGFFSGTLTTKGTDVPWLSPDPGQKQLPHCGGRRQLTGVLCCFPGGPRQDRAQLPSVGTGSTKHPTASPSPAQGFLCCLPNERKSWSQALLPGNAGGDRGCPSRWGWAPFAEELPERSVRCQLPLRPHWALLPHGHSRGVVTCSGPWSPCSRVNPLLCLGSQERREDGSPSELRGQKLCPCSLSSRLPTLAGHRAAQLAAFAPQAVCLSGVWRP